MNWTHVNRNSFVRFRCSASRNEWSRKRQIVLVTCIAITLRLSLATSQGCKLSRGSGESLTVGHEKWLTSGGDSRVRMDCRSRGITRVPTNIASDVTDLDLAGNNISYVLENDFVNRTNLRVLILSNSRIKTLQRHCFHKLLQLERLDLTGNNIESLPSGVFVGLRSLRVLTMSGLPLTSYPTEFVTHTTELRVLSLSAIGDATIPAEYAHLPRLEVLDFFKDATVNLKKITAAMFDNIRDSNITTLAIRYIRNINDIEKGAFSNLPAVRSLILACNGHLHLRPTVATLASTTNTSINTVMLDGARADDLPNTFKEADFCSPFWHNVQRLSVKSTLIVHALFNHAGCLSQLREINFEYNAISKITPSNTNLSAVFPQSVFLIMHGIVTGLLLRIATRECTCSMPINTSLRQDRLYRLQ